MRFALFMLAACGVLQAAVPVEIWPSGELQKSAGQLSADAESKGLAGKTLGAWGGHSASLWRRAKSGAAELHKTKADLFIIEQGSATLVFGGTLVDPKTGAPNEVRGTSIKGGESRKLAPGDVVHIPPGVPHQFVLEKGQSVAYYAVKIGG